VRDDELRRILADANPWWASVAAGTDPTAWTESNRVLRERTRYDLGYRSGILRDITARPTSGDLTVLTGPRRAGKTVTILDTAAQLCATPSLDPRQVIYVPCDGMAARDLRRVLTLARALTQSVNSTTPRTRIWLFDEISGIPGWSSVLKAARDTSDFGDDTVVATGSRWVTSEDIQGNLLAGRAGSGTGHRLRQLLPMNFPDYLAATRPDLPRLPTTHPAELDGTEATEATAALAFIVDGYDLAWQDYLTSGGFPRAVAEHQRTGAVSSGYLRDLLAWLRADVDPDAPTESVPLLLSAIAQRMTSPLNLTSTAAVLGYPNRPTFDRRVQRLVNSHASIRCRQRTDDGGAVSGAQPKLYLTDPILAWLPSLLSLGLPAPDFTALTEMTIAVALARVIDEHDEGRWIAEDTIGYARTASGGEVDLAPVRIPTSSGPALTTPIESKWVDSGWRGESKTIEAKYGRGIVATKSILDLAHPSKAIPAPMLACLIG
jgi:predicted AAA+ superfamily ATPase